MDKLTRARVSLSPRRSRKAPFLCYLHTSNLFHLYVGIFKFPLATIYPLEQTLTIFGPAYFCFCDTSPSRRIGCTSITTLEVRLLNQMLGYIVLGLSLSAPIGPVNAAQLSKGIRGGFMSAWLVGLGAMTADVIYMLLVFFGVIHFLNIPFMQTFLWLFGGFLLIYTGIESLKDAGKLQMADMRGREPLLKSFMSGFFMSLGNPLSILFWLGIYGSVLAQTAARSGLGDLILNSFSIILGLLIWDLTMAGFATIFRNYVSERLLKGVSMLSGLFLIGFGLYFLFEALQLLLQRI